MVAPALVAVDAPAGNNHGMARRLSDARSGTDQTRRLALRAPALLTESVKK
jgi:hypothetical protein